MDHSTYSSQNLGWEAQAHPDSRATQPHFEVASSQLNYPNNTSSRRQSRRDFYDLAREDQSLHHPVQASSSRAFSDSYTHSHPPHQQPVSYYGTHYTHQHSQRAHRYHQTQYQQLDHPRALSASSQSAVINSAAPQPRANIDHHPSNSTPANRFAPYGNISGPAARPERMADPAIDQYKQAELDVSVWGYTDAAGPPAPDNNTTNGVDRSAPALPVASQFAGLTLAQHNPPGVKDEAPVPPVAPVVNSQRAQPSVVDTSHEDSSSDTIMPDAFDIIPPKPAKNVPSQGVPSEGAPSRDKKKSSASAPTMPSVQAPKSQKSTRAPKTTTQKAGDNNMTSNSWTIDQHDRLIHHILDSDTNFNKAEKKGGCTTFWKQVSEKIFEGKRSPEALQLRWKELKAIYQQIKALESFTGGDGDGEFTIDGDDSEATILDKLRGRLDIIRERKPNIDPQHKVKNADTYWDWIRGGDESWYRQMHARFRDLSTFDRKHAKRSGSLSPLEIDSDSDGGTTSKSDTNTPKRSVKSRAARAERGTRGLTGLDAAATAAKEFFAAQHSSRQLENNVAIKRLKFEQDQAQVANELSLKTMEMRCETQKRKWSNDKRMAAMAEEDAKRRRTIDDTAAQEERVLNRVRELNKLVADPTTDPALKEIYREQIKTTLSRL